MKDNIVLISSKEPNEKVQGKVSITYTDDSIEIIEADYMGMSDEIPGFLILWNDNPYDFKGYFNMSNIKKIGTSSD